MLRRKPHSLIIEFIRNNWGLSKAQAYNYIALARKEWEKYYNRVKGWGIGYHVAQMRDLKDKALASEDLRLAFDISKEEAKLMGIYPREKHDIKLQGRLETNIDEERVNELIKLAYRAIESNMPSEDQKQN